MSDKYDGKQFKSVLKFSLIYLFFSCGWIFLVEGALYPLVFETATLNYRKLIKDIIFFLGSWGIFFVLIAKFTGETAVVQSELEQQSRRLQALFDNLPGMAYRYRAGHEEPVWELEFVSSKVKELTGYTAGELLETDEDFYQQLIHPEEQEEVLTTVRKTLREQENYVIEYRIRTKDDKLKWVEDRGRGIYDEQDNLVAVEGLIEEITEIKSARRSVELARNEAEYLAHHDSLTGLPSRGYFLEEATNWLRESKSGSGAHRFLFCIVDIIDFQKFNNFYGYWLGNRILEETAQWLKSKLPEESLVGRLGGDEFGVFLPLEDDVDKIEERVEELLCPLERSFEVEDEEINYHMQVGVAIYPEDGRGLEEMLAAANRAVNREEGGLARKKILVYRDADLKKLEVKIKSSEKLLGALNENRLQLYYQPVVDSRDDSNYMLEALLRIKTPGGEMRTLQNYTDVIYDSRLTERLDLWVIDKVLEQTGELVEQEKAPYISLNLFPASILKESVYEELDERVKKAGYPRRKLVIEVTEKLLGTYSSEAVNNLLAVTNDYNFRIALDDFGVGHGSFQTLKKLDLDFLKIDGSFILDLDENEMNQNFVHSLAELGQQIDVPVVGEWVETQETAEKLLKMKVFYQQGYYYAEPKKLGEILENC